jgi:hypothetical protein
MTKHSLLSYTAMESPLVSEELRQTVVPHFQLVAEPSAQKGPQTSSPSCKITDTQVDPKTNTITETLEYTDGKRTIQRTDAQGVTFSQDKYDKNGVLTSSKLLTPDDVLTGVNILQGKGKVPGNKEIAIKFPLSKPIKFTMSPSGMISPLDSRYAEAKPIFDKKGLLESEITDPELEITIRVTHGRDKAAGWKTIDIADSNGSPLTDVIFMKPDGEVYLRGR